MPVQAGDLDVSSVYDDDMQQWVDVETDTWLWPCFQGLPMGWSWALFLCHSALTDGMLMALMSFNPSLDRAAAADQLVRDRCPAPKLSARRPLLAPYVDNGSAIGYDEKETLAYHKLMVEELQKPAFVLKDIVEACPILDMTGLEFNGNERIWRHRSKRPGS